MWNCCHYSSVVRWYCLGLALVTVRISDFNSLYCSLLVASIALLAFLPTAKTLKKTVQRKTKHLHLMLINSSRPFYNLGKRGLPFPVSFFLSILGRTEENGHKAKRSRPFVSVVTQTVCWESALKPKLLLQPYVRLSLCLSVCVSFSRLSLPACSSK